MEELVLKSFDCNEIQLYVWDDVKKPVGVVQLVHGSCEHARRYATFARNLNDIGWIVVANDHRGHGKTAQLQKTKLGCFNGSWLTLVNDLKYVNDFIKEKYNNLPVVMFGHSMGSFLALSYFLNFSDTIEKLILSGFTWYGKLTLMFAQTVSKNEKIDVNGFCQSFQNACVNHLTTKIKLALQEYKIKTILVGGGVSANSKVREEINLIGKEFNLKTIFPKFEYCTDNAAMIGMLAYKTLNNRFRREGDTGSEWLSANVKNREKFNADPKCGFVFSNNYFYEMFWGLSYNQKSIKKINKDKKIFIIAGKNDPVGGFGKKIKNIC